MNLDDESYLSAYLDNELGPADRRSVEWSIESSPPLADQLRSIASTRDVVAGLDRPAIPRDLAPAIVAKIARDRTKARHRPGVRVALAASGFAGFLAIAASLIFAIIRLHPALHPTDPPLIVRAEPIAGPAPAPRPEAIPTDPAPLPEPAVEPVEDVKATPREILVESAPGPVEAAEEQDRRVLTGILGRSHVRRIMITTDVIAAPTQIRNLIAQGGRETPEFGQISICQEIVIDPEHAEAAVVFAVPIDERGRKSFVDRLRRDFPDLIEEGESTPELVTQLTEVGRVAIFRGLEAAPLGDPPGHVPDFIANRQRAGHPFILEPDRGPVVESLESKRPPVVAGKSDIDPDFVGPPDPRRKPPAKPGDRVTLLVWVTRPGRQ